MLENYKLINRVFTGKCVLPSKMELLCIEYLRFWAIYQDNHQHEDRLVSLNALRVDTPFNHRKVQ